MDDNSVSATPLLMYLVSYNYALYPFATWKSSSASCDKLRKFHIDLIEPANGHNKHSSTPMMTVSATLNFYGWLWLGTDALGGTSLPQME